MTSLQLADHFDRQNIVARIISGGLLALGALAAVSAFGFDAPIWKAPFLMMITVGGVVLSIEWSTMTAQVPDWRVMCVSSVAVLAVILIAFAGRFAEAAGGVVVGALASSAMASAARARAMDTAYGVIYIAPACLALMWLIQTPQGPGWTLMLFAATWTADIAAFVFGNIIKGPKLWPRFSPNKTWAGFIAGLLGATLASLAVAAAFMRLSLLGAGVIGFAGGLATMAGDLWESMLKRRYGVKDSGDLIPGHGGLLDRVDGLMFAVMVFAVARLFVQLRWAH